MTLPDSRIFIGIDLSGPSNTADTAVSVFKQSGSFLCLLEYYEGADDALIFGLADQHASAMPVFGLDAPLSYNPGGGDRPGDRQLRKLVNKAGGAAAVMPPTLTRMCYLTLRGVHLAHILSRRQGIRIGEVHPLAGALLRGADAHWIRNIRSSKTARRKLTVWYEKQGLKNVNGIRDASDHLIASFGCAFAAWKWVLNECIWKYPAAPPHHPFDYIC